MRDLAKAIGRAAGLVLVAPRLLWFFASALVLGRERAFEGAMQGLARCPGLRGIYMRRAFLTCVIDSCHPSVTVSYGVLMSKTGATLGENVYVGPGCSLGLVSLEPDVLLADGVRIPSGAHTHATNDVNQAIRDQGGTLMRVRVGRGTWIGSGAVVLADVGSNSVIGAGSVVTRPIPDNVVAVGVPATVVRTRS
jgi:acetyltransferase-like isoleucine patch superfamily enzyme